MRILAIETSLAGGTLALLEGADIVATNELKGCSRVAQALVPAIGELLAKAAWRAADVKLTAVAVGPGSFTGLRVGVTTAKVFAYAIGAEVVGVSTLAAIAAGAESRSPLICPVIDAQRRQLFAARYERRADGELVCLADAYVISIDDWLAGLAPPMAVAGPGLDLVVNRLPPGIERVDRRQPTAAHVGLLAWRDYQAGRRDDLWRLAPRYIRPSAAEEKLNGNRLCPEGAQQISPGQRPGLSDPK